MSLLHFVFAVGAAGALVTDVTASKGTVQVRDNVVWNKGGGSVRYCHFGKSAMFFLELGVSFCILRMNCTHTREKR